MNDAEIRALIARVMAGDALAEYEQLSVLYGWLFASRGVEEARKQGFDPDRPSPEEKSATGDDLDGIADPHEVDGEDKSGNRHRAAITAETAAGPR